MKQKDLAEKLGISKTGISEYQRRKLEIRPNLAKKLHHQLNLDREVILQEIRHNRIDF